jgi:molecular chaperone GrpE
MAAGKKDHSRRGSAADGGPSADEPTEEMQSEEVVAEVLEPEIEQAQDGDAQTLKDDGKTADEAQDENAPNLFDAITAEVTDLRDRYARLQAEWDNYRKRTASERESERTRASEKLVTDLLPALDDLERAINHAKESGESGNLIQGVEATQNKFLQILEKHKVVQVEAMGTPFDAMQHQAVGTEQDETVPEETVVKVYQQGYKMGERVIRPAMVITSTGGPAREPEKAEE